MTINDFVQYIWIPVMGYLWSELSSIKKKLDLKASKEDIAEYLEPRIAPLQSSISQTHDLVAEQGKRMDSLIITILSWQKQQNHTK